MPVPYTLGQGKRTVADRLRDKLRRKEGKKKHKFSFSTLFVNMRRKDHPDYFSAPYSSDQKEEDWYPPDAELTKALRQGEKQFPALLERTKIARYEDLMPFEKALQGPNLDSGTGYWLSDNKQFFKFMNDLRHALLREGEIRGDKTIPEMVSVMGYNQAVRSPFRPDVIHTHDFETSESDPRLNSFFDIWVDIVWHHFWSSFDYCEQHPELVRVTTKRSSSMGVTCMPDGRKITKDNDPETGILFPMPEPFNDVFRVDWSVPRSAYFTDILSPNGCYQITKRGVELAMTSPLWTSSNVVARIMDHQDRSGTTGVRLTSQDGSMDPYDDISTSVSASKPRPFEVEIGGYRILSGIGSNEELAKEATQKGEVGLVCTARRFFAMRSDVQLGPALWAKAWLYKMEEGPACIPSLKQDYLDRINKWVLNHPTCCFFRGDRHNAEKYISSNKWMADKLVPPNVKKFLVDFHGTKITGSRYGHRMHQWLLSSGDAFTTFWNVMYGVYTKMCIYTDMLSKYYKITDLQELRKIYAGLLSSWMDASPSFDYKDWSFCISGSTDDVCDGVYCTQMPYADQIEQFAKKICDYDALDKDWQMEITFVDDCVAFGNRYHNGKNGTPGVEFSQANTLKYSFGWEHPGISIRDLATTYVKSTMSGYSEVIDSVIKKQNWGFITQLEDLAGAVTTYENWLQVAGCSLWDDLNEFSPSAKAAYQQYLISHKGGMTSEDPLHDTLKGVTSDLKKMYLDLALPLRDLDF